MGIDIAPHVDICFICVHYDGTKIFETRKNLESDHRNVCKAFPNGIPFEILTGKNKHLIPLKSQKNNIIFKK